jgi:hypothetical protein
MQAQSISGDSLVSAAVTFEVTGGTGGSADVQCEFTGSGVTSSRPMIRLHSEPRGMAQMVIFAEVSEGSTAVLSCNASVTGGTVVMDYRWDGALGIRANTTDPQNGFTASSIPN